MLVSPCSIWLEALVLLLRISVLRKLVRRKYLRIFSRRLKNSSLHGG
nr:MAG TPA: hypothetical protein [Caudoviricetes sp.]